MPISEESYIKEIKDNGSDRSIFVEEFLNAEDVTKLLIASDFSIMNYGPTQFSTSGACRMLMSHGIPSCSANVRILEDLNPSMSLKFDCNNTYDMASCIVALALDPNLRKSLGDSALAEGLRTSWGSVAEQHVNLYRSLLK
jgi:glycosyltransferase involved in cell wall biosynthesis